MKMNSDIRLICFGAILLIFHQDIFVLAENERKNESLKMISNSLNQFSTAFFKDLAKEETGNLICSPVSVSMVLSMTAFGAGGETSREMRSALHSPIDDSISKNGFSFLIESLNKIKKVNLEFANKIFTAIELEVKPTFKDITAKSFNSEVQAVDFENTETASSQINAWSSAKTNGRIQQVIKPDDIRDAVMVLINAVYFKGNWEKKFPKYLTSPKAFYVNEQTTKEVAMMHITERYNYGLLPDLDAVFVEMPYEHENDEDAISMFIILPHTIDGLEKAESNLQTVNFKQLHKVGHKQKLELSVPKFKIESSLRLKSVLTKMGMGKMFSSIADFTGIADSPPLKISKVIQKAFIEVNEEGSEAAAVTAVIGVPMAAAIVPVQPIIVKIERPFIYAIVHASSNVVLFQGHITDPMS